MAKKNKLIATLDGTEPAFKENNSAEEISSAETNYRRIIKSAKIVDDLTLDVKYHENLILISSGGTKRVDVGGTISRTGDNAIHDDLKSAFAKLTPHLALIAEMVDDVDSTRFDKFISGVITDDTLAEMFKYFKVTGFSIGGSGESEGVTLIGQKELTTSKILNITTPFTKWDDGDYKYVSELAEAIESCKHEVIEYLNGKMAPPAQVEMEFEEQEESQA